MAPEMITVLIDTNVLISGLVGHGKPRRLVTELLEKQEVVSSRGLLAELLEVLSRDKFKEVEKSQVESFLSILASKLILVSDEPRHKVILEDPDDDLVLCVARLGKADYIVTGDRHLLDLKQYKKIRIVTVKDMLELLHNQDG